jgi:hypothetical protein
MRSDIPADCAAQTFGHRENALPISRQHVLSRDARSIEVMTFHCALPDRVMLCPGQTACLPFSKSPLSEILSTPSDYVPEPVLSPEQIVSCTEIPAEKCSGYVLSVSLGNFVRFDHICGGCAVAHRIYRQLPATADAFL